MNINKILKISLLFLTVLFFQLQFHNLKAEDIVVVIFHDHGTRYVGKLFNDDWMKKQKFFDK